MGRIRTIKPEFPQSESMGRISREARLCFILLWTIVDDAGRTRANSRMLASLLYPYDGDICKRVEGWLNELAAEKCLVLYERDGNKYLEICKWLEHQKIDRPSKPRIPGFDEHSRVIVEDSSTDQRTKGPKDQRTGTEGSAPATEPSEEELSGTGLSIEDYRSHQAVRKAKKSSFSSQDSRNRWIALWKKFYSEGKDTAAMMDLMIASGWVGEVDNRWKQRKVEYRPATPEDDVWADLGAPSA